MMVKGATLKLKRALGKQVRYEDGHFDRVITRYRECSAGDWSSSHPLPATNPSTSSQPSNNSTTTKKERTTPLEMMTSIKSEFFPSTWNWVAPHILELEAGQGGIKPHVDHLDASGSVVAGLCLGSSAVMELIHQDDPQKWFRVLLPKRCFYFQRDSVRYSYKHGIPIEAEDHQFKGVVVPKEKRISVMLRVRFEHLFFVLLCLFFSFLFLGYTGRCFHRTVLTNISFFVPIIVYVPQNALGPPPHTNRPSTMY
jgi:alkylated DNA repair protein alkB family protein 7